MFTSKEAILARLREASESVLPIVTIVAVLCLLFIPLDNDLMLSFLIGAVFLVFGMGLFSVGADLSMSEIGSLIGSRLTRSRNPVLILSVSFLLGFAVTMAEPDLQVLAKNVPAIDTTVLVIVVSLGVGAFLMLSMLRILRGIPLRWMLLGFYGVIFLLGLLSQADFLPVSFDAGGVTTGPMTVPFIMALGVGVASIRSDARAKEDSFGLVGLCSIGPVLAVLILGFIYQVDADSTAEHVLESYENTLELGTGYLTAIPENLKEMTLALLPIVGFFLVFQVVTLRLTKKPFLRIVIGLLMTLGGLTLFLTGVNVGFSSLGFRLGERMAEPQWRLFMIPVSALMGWFIINAEPAVHVLNRQVEELSGGAISAKAMRISLSIGIAAAMGLSLLRAMTGISLLWFILPGYALSLGLSFIVPGTFTSIAFDSGGVASGPLTAAFMLPFAMGAVHTMGGNVMTDAFGLVSMVAMMPLITVQIMGVLSVLTARRKAGRMESAPVSYSDTDIIELWEV